MLLAVLYPKIFLTKTKKYFLPFIAFDYLRIGLRTVDTEYFLIFHGLMIAKLFRPHYLSLHPYNPLKD